MAWFRHVSDAVYDMLCAALGLDPDSESTMDRVVPAYVPGTTVPQYNSNQNVVFYALSEEQMSSDNYVTLRNEQNMTIAQKVIPVSCLLSFYGPDADDEAEHCWSSLMIDLGEGSPRSILRGYRIVLNYGLGKMPPRPVSVPELEGTLWRRRSDLRLSMSYLDMEQLGFTPIELPPEITASISELPGDSGTDANQSDADSGKQGGDPAADSEENDSSGEGQTGGGESSSGGSSGGDSSGEGGSSGDRSSGEGGSSGEGFSEGGSAGEGGFPGVDIIIGG